VKQCEPILDSHRPLCNSILLYESPCYVFFVLLKDLINALNNNFTDEIRICEYSCELNSYESKFECKVMPSPEIRFRIHVS
jgi:hypothetical protein